MTRTHAQIEAEAQENQKAHRAAEAAAMALLLSARRRATRENAAAFVVATRIQTSVRDAIVLARQNSRSRGIARLAAEAGTIGAEMGPSVRTAIRWTAHDWQRANYLGRSYAARWLKKAEEHGSARLASAETAGSLERIAVSESSEAFTHGRSLAVADLDVATEFYKVWDATLDRRTCPICSDADGTMVSIARSFPAGEPGSVHSFCRCGWTLISGNETKTHIHLKAI